ncbi:MAG: copper chaperone PCu(A)C [Pseudomonadota bacterium]
MTQKLLFLPLIFAASVAMASDTHDHDHEHDHDDHAEHAEHDDHSDHLAEVDGIRILHAWTTPPVDGAVRIYLDIENEGDVDITLVGAEVHGAGDAVVAGLDFKTDGMPAIEIGAFPVPAGTELKLVPTGPFLLLDGMDPAPVAGASFDMHLVLEPVGEVEVHVDVEAEGTTEHPHAGHNH